MSGRSLRQALGVFDDAALASLASKGLLRRAARDVEAGKVRIAQESENRATIEADGETVEISAEGPAAARCSCRARGVCRHRLAAALLLRGVGETGEDRPAPDEDTAAERQDPTRPAERPDNPLAEVLALTPEEIAKWAGKATLRAASEICDGARAPDIQIEGPALVVRLDAETAEVRYLAGQGLAGMISKAPRTKRKALHAAAVLAVRRRHLPDDQAEDKAASQGEPEAAAPADPRFLGAVADCLADCVRSGFNQASLALEERLFALSVSSRADALPRLSALLRTLAARVRAKRERDFALDLDAYLALVAEAYALAQALLSESNTPLDPAHAGALRGQVRQDYQPIGRLTLLGMGARHWRTAAGASGVTGYFYAPAQARWYSAGRARAASHDVTFSPKLSYERETLWDAGTLAALSRGKIELDGAAAAPDGRLSLGKGAHGRILPWSAKTAELGAWSLAFDTWEHLEAHLQGSFPSGLGQRRHGMVPVVLMPETSAEPYFDEVAQETVWPLRDANGAWLALTLGHQEGTGSTAADFERILRSERPGAVAALALPARKHFELQPYALFLPGADGGCHNIGLDPIGNAGVDGTGSRLRRLGRSAAAVIGIGRAQFARPTHATATDKALAEASDALLGLAELGGACGADSTHQVQALSARLRSYGLDPLAQALGRLGVSDKVDLAPRLLEAVHLIDRTRALLRPLPALRQL